MKKRWLSTACLSLCAVATVGLFASCTIGQSSAPASLAAAQMKMEKAGYETETYEMDGVSNIYAEKDGEVLSAALYESSSAAKDSYERIEAYSGVMPEGYVLKWRGKWVITGTEAAVGAFLK